MSLFIVLVLAMSLGARDVSALRTVMVRNQSSPVVVVEGRMVHMSCRTEKQWFFCLWYSPRQDMQCAIQYNQPERICSKSKNTVLTGGQGRCDIQFQVSTDMGRSILLTTDWYLYSEDKTHLVLALSCMS